MRQLKKAFITKKNIKDVSTHKSSKYIIVPYGNFYEKMSSNRKYWDKKINNCPYAFLWILDENDLVDLEQKFYRYGCELFKAPPESSFDEIKEILETIYSKSHFTNNNFTKMEEEELFDLIKRLKRIKG